MVASIIKDKEELGMWERNPDYKEQKMYHCWDATATIRDNTNATSTEVTTEGGISTQDAKPMLSCSQLLAVQRHVSFQPGGFEWFNILPR